MTDRELLELAAKAVGNGAEYIRWVDVDNGTCAAFMVPNAGGWGEDVWNPLTDDGDALRLAVKLRMSFQSTEYYAVCYAGSPSAIQFTEKATMGYSIEEATRRAIVRAAAEIGRNMK